MLRKRSRQKKRSSGKSRSFLPTEIKRTASTTRDFEGRKDKETGRKVNGFYSWVKIRTIIQFIINRYDPATQQIKIQNP
jgi:hypothetical protein